jgi:hypothetical protein
MPGAPLIRCGELLDWIGNVSISGRVVLYADTPPTLRGGGGFAALRLGGRRNMRVLEDGLGGRTRRGLPLEVAR